MREIFREQALANRHVNETWLAVMRGVPFAVLDADRGAFFGSIFATWNHILLGDRIWLGRIHGRPLAFDSLGQRLCADLDTLERERARTDADLIALVEAEDDLGRTIAYHGNQGQPDAQRLYQILNHLFAHQHHHRGQISQMCHRLGIALPDGGLIGYYRGPGR